MNDDETIGQYAWGFSLYLLARFGAELRATDFYAAKYQAAFPHLLEPLKDRPYHTRQQQFYGNHTRRMHGLFAKWFGLVTIEHTPYDAQTPTAPDRVAATPALRQLFWVVGE